MKITIAQVRRVIAEEVRRRLNELEDQAQFYKPPAKRGPAQPPAQPDKRHFIHGMDLARRLYHQGMDLLSITFELEKKGFEKDDIDVIFDSMNEALIRRLSEEDVKRPRFDIHSGNEIEDPDEVEDRVRAFSDALDSSPKSSNDRDERSGDETQEVQRELAKALEALSKAKKLVRSMGSNVALVKALDKLADQVGDVKIGLHHLSGSVSTNTLESRRQKAKALREMRDEHPVIKGPWSEDHSQQPDYMSQHGEHDISGAESGPEQDCDFCERSGKCPACGGKGEDRSCMCSGGGDCPECVGRVMTGRNHV